jgi:hypothetical protein
MATILPIQIQTKQGDSIIICNPGLSNAQELLDNSNYLLLVAEVNQKIRFYRRGQTKKRIKAWTQ